MPVTKTSGIFGLYYTSTGFTVYSNISAEIIQYLYSIILVLILSTTVLYVYSTCAICLVLYECTICAIRSVQYGNCTVLEYLCIRVLPVCVYTVTAVLFVYRHSNWSIEYGTASESSPRLLPRSLIRSRKAGGPASPRVAAL